LTVARAGAPRGAARPIPADQQWPIYFVGKDLDGPRQRLRRGEQWATQSKSMIRAWASSFGEDEKAEWHRLGFVETIAVPMSLADTVMQRQLSRDDTVALLESEGWQVP
jgi:hypothetical protein